MNVRSLLTPEARLLLATAGSGARDEELACLLEAPLDWRRLLDLALRERSLPPLWRRLAPLAGGRFPAEAVEAFDRAAANRRLFLALLHHRLVEALGVLEDGGIPVLLIKGAALAHSGYGDFVDRPMADLDLLVNPEHARRAWTLMRGIGWTWKPERYPAPWYRGMHHLPPLEDSRETGAVLEVHSAALVSGHGYRFGAEDLWRGAREIHVEGRTTFVPRPVPHLVHVCIHFAWVHQLGRGAWRTFRDLEVLAGMDGFRWEPFLEAARDSGAGRCGFWTLLLGRELASAAVPARVLEDLHPAGLPSPLLDALSRHYAVGLLGSEASCPSMRLRRLLWRIGVHPARDRRTPWPGAGRDEDAGPAGGEPSAAHEERAGKLARHVRDRGEWAAYLRSVLGRASP
ncbi:MAG TPA: nucleotidyltransferase family protein [Gemmatimonadota bacterium]|nr:nucleotidyltransferase family protein [Gemmatimonadota bacterium]